MKEIYLVSWYGKTDVGGVERVTKYIEEACAPGNRVTIIDFKMAERSTVCRLLLHRHYTLDAAVMSAYAYYITRHSRRRDRIIITQGYNAPFLKADFIFAHGTMRGFKAAMHGGGVKWGKGMGRKRLPWKCNELFERHAMRRAHRVIAVSRRVKGEAAGLYGVDPAKMLVLENGVDTECFCPVSRGEASAVPGWRKQEGRCTILFSGRLEERKGLSLLRRLAEAVEQREDMRLLVASPSRAQEDSFRGLRHTEIFTGLSMEEMRAFYQTGDVAYFPSLYEGFALSCLEILSSGVPVAGGCVGGLRELSRYVPDAVVILGGRRPGKQRKPEDREGQAMEEVLAALGGLAEAYRAPGKKEALHARMKEKYDIKPYMARLRAILLG